MRWSSSSSDSSSLELSEDESLLLPLLLLDDDLSFPTSALTSSSSLSLESLSLESLSLETVDTLETSLTLTSDSSPPTSSDFLFEFVAFEFSIFVRLLRGSSSDETFTELLEMLLDRGLFFLDVCSSSSSLESLELSEVDGSSSVTHAGACVIEFVLTYLLSDELLESDEEPFLLSAGTTDPFLGNSFFGASLSSSLMSDSELLFLNG